MYTALLIPKISKVFCKCKYTCSWMQNGEILTFKMLPKSFLGLIIAWNWMSSYRAACSVRLLGTVNSYTDNTAYWITYSLSSPTSTHSWVIVQFSSVVAVSIRLCMLSTISVRSECVTILYSAKVKTIFSNTDSATSSVTKSKTV